MLDENLRRLFKETVPPVEFASLRYHRDENEVVAVRQDVPEPLYMERSEGVMVTVRDKGGMGYAATSDLSREGLTRAFEKARAWAERTAALSVPGLTAATMPHPKGEFRSPVKKPWASVPLSSKLDRLTELSRSLKVSPMIVDWSAQLWHARSERLYLTSGGGEVYQDFDRLVPMLSVTANEGSVSQTRTFGGMAWARQQGLELLDETRFYEVGVELAREAIELVKAKPCPEGRRDVLLAPDQMILQIHESIGHPLELDRILGDERNYAGTSFVTLDMFGTYQYGSPLLNVTFDPTRAEETASYAFDDEGARATKEYVIKDGILLRPLGGTISQARAGIAGTANTRADSWNRPPIDRMANLNVEPGASKLEDMIASIERGIYMKTNCSWSIDDSRNKFQFGCEWGRLIENGKLAEVVRTPCYRGISASFWRSLKMVGDASTFEVLGTPYCGKGEPNQAVFVGHATPACVFSDVEVFGGE